MMLDIEELKRLAMAATPGPWYEEGRALFQGVSGQQEVFCLADGVFDKGDAQYMAAANPSVILKLIERLERAEGRWNWIRSNGPDGLHVESAEELDSIADHAIAGMSKEQ